MQTTSSRGTYCCYDFWYSDSAGKGVWKVKVTNNASAGAITTSGFTLQDGDSITTTNGHKFLFYITKTNTYSYCNVKALQ